MAEEAMDQTSFEVEEEEACHYREPGAGMARTRHSVAVEVAVEEVCTGTVSCVRAAEVVGPAVDGVAAESQSVVALVRTTAVAFLGVGLAPGFVTQIV